MLLKLGCVFNCKLLRRVRDSIVSSFASCLKLSAGCQYVFGNGKTHSIFKNSVIKILSLLKEESTLLLSV